MKNNPLVSVITPVFNGADYIEELILSVQNQSYSNIEHIIIDDGSNDEGKTVEILKKYKKVTWWSRKNRGQFFTINEGIKSASGDIILIISADDKIYEKDTISKAIEFWQLHSDLSCLYGHTFHMDKNSQLMTIQTQLKGAFPRWFIKYRSVIAHCSLFLNRDFIIKNDLFFDVNYKYFADWEWVIRISKEKGKIKFIDLPVALYRIHENQTINTNYERRKAEIEEILKKYGMYRFSDFFVQCIVYFKKLRCILKSEYKKKGVIGVCIAIRDEFFRIKAKDDLI